MVRRPRVERRARQRQVHKLLKARFQAFAHEAGGSPERARQVASSSLVEIDARATPCPGCNAKLEVLDHHARLIEGLRVREVTVRCPLCRRSFSLWFRIGPAALH